MATTSVVGEEVKFTLGMRLVRDYIPRSVLVEQLLEIASDHVSLGTVYTDAVKFGIGVVNTPEEKRLSYLIRQSSDNRVARFVADIDHEVVVNQSHEMEKTGRGESVTPRPWSGFLRLGRKIRR